MKVSISRSDAVSNTDYVKVPIFLDFFDNIPDFSPIALRYFPILCKLDKPCTNKLYF